MKRCVLALGWLWALPTSLVGLIIIGLSGASPYALRPAGAWWWVARMGFWYWWLKKNEMAALTCGAVTVCLPGYGSNPTLVRHERQHLLQAYSLGAFFIPAYYLMAAMAWAAGRSAYRDDPLENDAYDEEDKPDSFG